MFMATIKDIAEAAGVSIGTIDRIIHKRGRYSQKTAEQVEKIMLDFGYVPNIHARGLKNIKKHTFSAVIPKREQDSGYWDLVYKGLLRGSAELHTFGSSLQIYEFDRYSRESCLQVLDLALHDGSEGIITAPVRPEDMGIALSEGEKPFLFIDSNIPDMSGQISYIGQDSNQSGILSARLMSLLLMNKVESEILIIEPPGNNHHLKNRITGFLGYIHTMIPKMIISIEKVESYSEKAFQEFLETSFSKRDRLPDGIFVANSLVYEVAAFLEKDPSRFDGMHLIGYDMIPGKETYIESGIIDFIITQQPEEQGFKGVLSLYDSLVLGKVIPNTVNTPLHIITKENLKTFMIED